MSKFTKKNKEHLDSMTIGQGHTIMAGYIPEAVGAQTFSENYYKWKNPTPDTIAQFGFWGGDIDYNTYYPNLDKSELTPKDEEFIEPMFRLLSETIVSKNWNPTDFGQNGVLKASMKMLLGQTVNCDHETNIGNAIGAVSQVMWQEAYKDGSFTIPGGINGILKIDGKANPRIARGILMEPPSIHSNSVTVQFKWDKSHPSMEESEFYQKLGTYDSRVKWYEELLPKWFGIWKLLWYHTVLIHLPRRLVLMVKLSILHLPKGLGHPTKNTGMINPSNTSSLITNQTFHPSRKRTILKVLLMITKKVMRNQKPIIKKI